MNKEDLETIEDRLDTLEDKIDDVLHSQEEVNKDFKQEKVFSRIRIFFTLIIFLGVSGYGYYFYQIYNETIGEKIQEFNKKIDTVQKQALDITAAGEDILDAYETIKKVFKQD